MLLFGKTYLTSMMWANRNKHPVFVCITLLTRSHGCLSNKWTLRAGFPCTNSWVVTNWAWMVTTCFGHHMFWSPSLFTHYCFAMFSSDVSMHFIGDYNAKIKLPSCPHHTDFHHDLYVVTSEHATSPHGIGSPSFCCTQWQLDWLPTHGRLRLSNPKLSWRCASG